ncbi:hypothetical protein LXL04_021827 [Taraxacum kok-saghyz]
MEATACFLNLRRPCSDLRREDPSSSRIALFLDLRRLSGMLQRRRCAGPPLEMLGVARRSIPRSAALTIRSLYLKRPTTGILCLRAADNVEDEDESKSHVPKVFDKMLERNCVYIKPFNMPNALYHSSSYTVTIPFVAPDVEEESMDTQSSTELKKLLETMEADKRDMEQQLKVMQYQIQELVLSGNRRTNGDNSNSGESIYKEGTSGGRTNDIKVEPTVESPSTDIEVEEVVEPTVESPLTDIEVEEVIGPDDGECLVVLRALQSTSSPAQALQRESIFHTRCTIAQKVCTVIVDGDSCTNVASQTLVDKLSLTTEPHPMPYVIHWCDVLPMDACHVLLGRPWQFDRRVTHDGYHNTYSFTYKGRKIVLTPITKSGHFMKTPPPLSTLLKAEQHEFHSFQEFILLGCEEDEDAPKPNHKHPLIKPLLQSYQHVFPTEIHSGLPPMRTIQHKIDLLPGSVLPNKPVYRANPQELAEIKKQIDGLLHKGLIRESLSPCAVPTLVVPKKYGEWRMCMDSRSINNITIKYRFPIPRLNDLLDELYGATVFSKGDEWKTTFKTKEGLYEWLVIPFGLSNAPSTFMRLMNQVDEKKVQVSRDWPVPQSIQQNPQAQFAFDELKRLLSSTPILALPCFEEVFEVECDASGVGIGAVLSQLGRPIAYYSEKFNDAKRRYSTYDKEFYAIIRSLDHWQHYLISKEFILRSGYEALKYIQGQHKLQPRHAKWVEFLQIFTFTIKHKAGKLNKGVDALSLKYSLLNSLQSRILGFDFLKDEYPTDPNFGELFATCHTHDVGAFHLHNGFLFRQQQLCIPRHSLRTFLIKEVHDGYLAGHQGVDKTILLLRVHFFWPKLTRDVEHFIRRCLPCHRAKTHSFAHGLYMPLPVPVAPWDGVSLDFITGLPRTSRHKDSIMVFVDRFSKMAHFVACHTTLDVVQVASLYFREIVRLHGVPKTMVSDCDVKFLSHFWLTLWRKLGTNLKFSTSSHPQTDGQTEVTNRTLGSLLRALIRTNLKQWEDLLPRAEFAYNRSPSKTTAFSPFMVVYGMNPTTPLDLAVLDTTSKFSKEASELATDIKRLHQQVHDKITKNNELLKYHRDKGRKHILFQPGDLVWIHLCKERFPSKRRSKLSPRSDGPFRIVAKVNDNADQVDLPGDYGVSSTFNVADLQPYFDPATPFQVCGQTFLKKGRMLTPHPSRPNNLFRPISPMQLGILKVPYFDHHHLPPWKGWSVVAELVGDIKNNPKTNYKTSITEKRRKNHRESEGDRLLLVDLAPAGNRRTKGSRERKKENYRWRLSTSVAVGLRKNGNGGGVRGLLGCEDLDLRREDPSSSRIALFLDLRRLSGMLQRRRCAGPPLEMLGVARRSIPRSAALTIRSLYLKRPTTGVLCLRAADNVKEDEDESKSHVPKVFDKMLERNCVYIKPFNMPNALYHSSSYTVTIPFVAPDVEEESMDTQSSTELKKLLETMEADKRDMEQQLKVMQYQIQELVLSGNRRTNGDNSNSGESIYKEGTSGGRTNDIKVEPTVESPSTDIEVEEVVEPTVESPLTDIEVEEVIGPDDGECLVVLRALQSTSSPAQALQRESIFHTRCTIAQKVCTVIVDGDSCTNVASQTLVDKLSLTTEPHPMPYVIHWCDVLPMDACHVLLGRPWQFDRRVTHDGYHNTYSFTYKGRKIVLTPITKSGHFMKTPPPLSTLLKAEQHEFHSFQEFILLGCEEDEDAPKPNHKHPLIKPLLQSYQHVFPTEIHSGLPPMRTIQHKIDLLPGSVLPNKPVYRANPQELAEIKKQIDGLLHKGLIRESLSPCAVPTLVVPKKYGEWRMCMDSRSINNITIKYRFPIPRLNDLLDELYGATVFSKGDEWKTTFKTKEGLYEWLVIPFGLSNAPSTFMRLMNQVDEKKVQVSRDWPVPQSIQQNPQAQFAFDELKRLLSSTPILSLPCFEEVFEVECDASGVGIGAVLSQLGRPIAYYSEKFNDAKRRYSTYDKEFYAIIRSLDHWQHYLISKEFILRSGYEALKYIQGQHKLQPRHAKWVEFLQIFTFTIKHKAGKLNKGVDALSLKYSLLNSLQSRILGFDFLKDEYPTDPNFGELFATCHTHDVGAFHLHNGFLFRQQQLCIPRHSLRTFLIKEVHDGYLAGHQGVDKTILLLRVHFFWPKLTRDVEHFIRRCLPCHRAKTHSFAHGLYMPLPVPVAPWDGVSLDFITGLPRTSRHKDSIMVFVDRFSKMAHFVACHTTLDVVQVASLYFREIVRLHGVPKTMVSDCDVKFLSHFWLTLWRKLGTNLKFSTSSHPQTDGQTEVTNRTLGSLLRALIRTNLKQWEDLLPRAEFAYNRSPSKTTAFSPFMVVYGMNPTTPLDLAVLDTTSKFSKEASELATDIKRLHQQVHDKITKNNELLKYHRDKGRKHILFQPGDLVWIHLCKERFPSKRRSKLSPRSDGPFRIVAKVNDNADQVDLPGDYGVSSTFNVADLQPYFDPATPFQVCGQTFLKKGRMLTPHPSRPNNLFRPISPMQLGSV